MLGVDYMKNPSAFFRHTEGLPFFRQSLYRLAYALPFVLMLLLGLFVMPLPLNWIVSPLFGFYLLWWVAEAAYRAVMAFAIAWIESGWRNLRYCGKAG